MSAKVDVAAQGLVTLPMLTMVGQVFPEESQDIHVSFALIFPELQLSGDANAQVSAVGSIELPGILVVGQVKVNVEAEGQLTLPLIQMSGSVTDSEQEIPEKPMEIVESSATCDLIENHGCTVELMEGQLFVTLSVT